MFEVYEKFQARYYFLLLLSELSASYNNTPTAVYRHSNSPKELSSFYNFPPPPTISYQFDERAHFDTLRHFPRDTTANTVSTTADVACEEYLAGDGFDDFSPSAQHDHEFVTFDLDRPLPLRAQSSLSISSRNGDRKKGFDGDPLRRTTPV